MRKELAQLLQTNQEGSARIRVEHIFREQNIVAAYEIIELFCELVVVRLPIIESQSQCPIDLREAVASLVFAAPRCADLPELQQIRNLFAVKYGKEFVAAAAELRPDCGVNRLIIEKLSVRAPSGEVKLKLMTEIAAEHGMEWDPTASESELLKAPEDLLEGPNRFLGASQMSLQTPVEAKVQESVADQNRDQVPVEPETNVFKALDISMGEKQYIPFVLPIPGDTISKGSSLSPLPSLRQPQGGNNESIMNVASSTMEDKIGSFNHREGYQHVHEKDDNFKDVAAAARAAAASAERAAAAARAAAALADGKLMGSSNKGDQIASDSSSDGDGDDFDKKEQRSEEGPTGNYFKIKRNSFNHQFTQEKPLFDDYTENRESVRASRAPEKKKQSGKGFSFDSDLPEEQPFSSQRSSRKYDDVFIEQDNNRRFLDSRKNASSKEWQFQDDDLRSQSVMGRNSDLSGAAPRFDTSSPSLYERQQSNTKTADEFVSQPPERPPPSLSGADETVGTKSVQNLPYVHPKLPDYDDLAARFESLRSKR